MNMDHTGETGHQVDIDNERDMELEPDVEIEAVLADDDVVIEVAEEEADATVALDAEQAAAEDAEAEASDESEQSADSEPSDDDTPAASDDDDEPGDGDGSAARHRHPAVASKNIVKRVAMDRSARIAVGSLVAVAMMFLFVFPTRSYLAQQGQVRDARDSVQELRLQNEKLAREAERLRTESEIEKLARSQFNMVFPGEEAYNVVPPVGAPTTTTEP
jgi:cell division protein FtsB